jgi:hypothetical protein
VSFIDKVAEWVREILAFGSPEFVAGAWFPVLAVVVFIAAMLVVRTVLPLAGKAGAALFPVLSALLGAVLLMPDMLIAASFRAVRGRPPALLYHYGDAVAASMIGIAHGSQVVASRLARVARTHVLIVALTCSALIWTWNHSHCPATPAKTTCVRPFTSWMNSFGDQPAPSSRPAAGHKSKS